MRKITWTAVLMMLALPAMAQAQQRGPGGGPGDSRGGMMFGRDGDFFRRPQGLALVQNALDQIQLTAEQKKKVEQLTEKLIGQIKSELTDEQKARLDQLIAQARFSALVGDRMLEYALRQLDLTEEQKQKMMPILQAHAQARRAYQQKTEARRQELMEQFRQMRQSGNMDREKMGQLFREFRQLREGGPGRDALVAKLLPVLTEEQTAQLKKTLEQMNQRMSRFGNRGSDRGGSDRGGGDRRPAPTRPPRGGGGEL